MLSSRRPFRSALSLLALATLAACAGGGSASLTPSTSASDTARLPQITAKSAPIPAAAAVAAVTPTLYVSGQGTVYTYPLGAMNNDPPTAALGSEYNGADGTAVAGIATDRKGTLYVLVNYGSLTAGGPGCKVVSYPFGSPTGTPSQLAYRCAPDVFYAAGISSGPNGEIDVLDTIDNAGNTGFQVERFFPNGTQFATSRLKLPSGRHYGGIGAGAAGNLFVAYNGNPAHVDKYAPLATGIAAPSAGSDLPNANDVLAISSGRGNVYISIGTTTPGPFNTQAAVYKGPPNLSSPPNQWAATSGYPSSRYLGPTAVDQSGLLYIADVFVGSGCQVEVFNSADTQVRTLSSPVRRGNPTGAIITGIAIAQ